MAKSTRKPRRTQAQKRIASDIARLRRKGLTRASAKRKSRPGGSAYQLLKKFRAVLDNQARVLTAPREVRETYKGTFPQARGKIAVPIKKGEKPRISKKLKAITYPKTFIAGEKPFQTVILPKTSDWRRVPKGPGISYRIYVGTSAIFFANYNLLREYIEAYETTGGPFKMNIGRIEVLYGYRSSEDDDEEQEE
jgi:hypothetical protein